MEYRLARAVSDAEMVTLVTAHGVMRSLRG
jgi:hypothetical protein